LVYRATHNVLQLVLCYQIFCFRIDLQEFLLVCDTYLVWVRVLLDYYVGGVSRDGVLVFVEEHWVWRKLPFPKSGAYLASFISEDCCYSLGQHYLLVIEFSHGIRGKVSLTYCAGCAMRHISIKACWTTVIRVVSIMGWLASWRLLNI
jgi:hypothetical protein